MSINYRKYLAETTKKLANPGLLLVSQNKQGKNNVMTIGWGLIGLFWRLPIFMIAVRPSRYTCKLIEETGEFTVNVPTPDMNKTVLRCGQVSGRDHDKLTECNLTPVKAKTVTVPVIQQCKIHYECKVVHKLDINPDQIPPDIKKTLYQSGNPHTLYFGQILDVY